ncbi:hypothetical protein PXD56_02560 [Maribacter sp. SA7]|uniref:hypothetical protein n=1 Tax=Maribacter zhoushanensis TaxID=3030012 RepID=UPI0023EB6E2F|nr:hypothetical protein [Maribacter zhoushanensis]MDF4201819.1 hypothetical protein [Maribacter zhoushanensis]
MQLDNALSPDKDKLFYTNLLFAKLYVHSLGVYMKKYNTNIDNRIPHRELNGILKQPYSLIVENLTSQMNDKLRFDLLESIGYKNDMHPQMLSELEKEKIISNLEKQLGLSCNYDAFMGNPWSVQEVNKGLSSTITQILAWNPEK